MSAVFDSLINYAPKSFLDEKEQTRACQRILASVVHLAIKDACNRPPTNKRGRSVGDMDTDAFTAMRFLFDDRCSGLKEYATWLDFDSSQFRRKLLKTMEEIVLKINNYLGYDFNTVELAIRDGIPYAIDFCNPAPDADLKSVGEENFEWVVEHSAQFAIETAQNLKEGKDNLSWGEYIKRSITQTTL